VHEITTDVRPDTGKVGWVFAVELHDAPRLHDLSFREVLTADLHRPPCNEGGDFAEPPLQDGRASMRSLDVGPGLRVVDPERLRAMVSDLAERDEDRCDHKRPCNLF
jgi:hypothetical protein